MNRIFFKRAYALITIHIYTPKTLFEHRGLCQVRFKSGQVATFAVSTFAVVTFAVETFTI